MCAQSNCLIGKIFPFLGILLSVVLSGGWKTDAGSERKSNGIKSQNYKERMVIKAKRLQGLGTTEAPPSVT